MKKFISLGLILIMIISSVLFISSCENKDGKNADGNNAVSEEIIENIGDYSIIRGVSASQTVKSAATDLKIAIEEKSGTKIKVTTDNKDPEALEIVIGETTRFSYDLALGEFLIKAEEKKIVITGGSDKAVSLGVDYFIANFISSKGVNLPTAEGFKKADENAYTSITVNGTPISEYSIVYSLYYPEAAKNFSQQLESSSYSLLPIYTLNDLDRVTGKYIMLDDTNTDFSKHSVEVKDGNIILYANYASMNSCIDSFFTDFLGYDTKSNKIAGSRDVAMKDGDLRTYNVEKSAIYTKDKLMSVLEDVYNSDGMIIIGQHMSERLGETMSTERKLYLENCGVESALYGYDIGVMESNEKSTLNAQVKDAYDMIEYMREGGIMTFSIHLDNPTGDGRAQGLDPHRGELGHEDKWEELMTEGTEINTNFMDTLENVADFLEIFHKNGAPVIFRPLHEMNLGAFWFCIQATDKDGVTKVMPKEYAVRLWDYIYNYIAVERGIDSMIWEYAPNVAARDAAADVMYCYPGDDKCDIVGADWYTSQYGGHELLTVANEDLAKTTGKIFSVTEFGPGEAIRTDFSKSPDYKFSCTNLDELIMEVTDDGIKTCYWMMWSSWADVKISMWNMGDANFFYENPMYLSLDEVAKLLYE